jgi:hypothetical protein
VALNVALPRPHVNWRNIAIKPTKTSDCIRMLSTMGALIWIMRVVLAGDEFKKPNESLLSRRYKTQPAASTSNVPVKIFPSNSQTFVISSGGTTEQSRTSTRHDQKQQS